MIRHLRSRNGRPQVVCSIICLQICAEIWLMIAALCKYFPSLQWHRQSEEEKIKSVYRSLHFFFFHFKLIPEHISDSQLFFSHKVAFCCKIALKWSQCSSSPVSLSHSQSPCTFLLPFAPHCHCSVLAAVPLPWRVHNNGPSLSEHIAARGMLI